MGGSASCRSGGTGTASARCDGDCEVPRVTPPDQIGQLFMVDFTGHEPSAEVERLIRDGVGGVILFEKNVAAPAQVAALTNALQRAPADAGRPPLLISMEQEGGPVVRLRAGATHFPSAMAFGAAGSEAIV